MKLFIKVSLLLLFPAISIAQQNLFIEEWNKEQIDSLQLIWNNSTNDTSCFPHFGLSHPDSPLKALKTLGFNFQFGWLGGSFEDVYPQKG